MESLSRLTFLWSDPTFIATGPICLPETPRRLSWRESEPRPPSSQVSHVVGAGILPKASAEAIPRGDLDLRTLRVKTLNHVVRTFRPHQPLLSPLVVSRKSQLAADGPGMPLSCDFSCQLTWSPYPFTNRQSRLECNMCLCCTCFYTDLLIMAGFPFK